MEIMFRINGFNITKDAGNGNNFFFGVPLRVGLSAPSPRSPEFFGIRSGLSASIPNAVWGLGKGYSTDCHCEERSDEVNSFHLNTCLPKYSEKSILPFALKTD
jgi:hypothetical protein